MTDPLFPPVIERADGNRCELWLSGKVESWKRNTAVKVKPKRGGKAKTVYFRDAKGIAYRERLAANARIACPVMLRSPVALEMLVVYPRPQSRPASVPVDVWRSGGEVLRPTKGRDDIDRLQGNVLDALKDAGVIEDDGCIVDIQARKVWAKQGGEPGLLLRVREVEYLF